MSRDDEPTAARVVRALRPLRFRGASEEELHRAIAEVLSSAGLAFAREAALGRGDRIDFLVGAVGVEAKMGGALSALTRQLHRYARSDQVTGLVVVTTRLALTRLPPTLGGKPLHPVHVGSYL